MQTNHGFEKIINEKINKETIFVHDQYLNTTKLGYWFIALNMQKCVELEV